MTFEMGFFLTMVEDLVRPIFETKRRIQYSQPDVLKIAERHETLNIPRSQLFA
ncbi:hypothetical protein [Sphingobacterium chuzhouense]|uniref:hypothetical protein n=1 Tax=Sphingobacterium chuzhouense TaxID=1742264 RepID=UPI0036D41FF0